MSAAEALESGRAILAADRRPTDEERALLEHALATTTDVIDRGALEALESALLRQSHARSDAAFKAHEDLWTEFYSTQQQHIVLTRTDPEVQKRFWTFRAAKEKGASQ
jgi:hypothetical protein